MDTLTHVSYLLSAVLFFIGLKQMGSPSTARNGNLLSAVGMLIAIISTLLHYEVINFSLIIIAILVGSIIGAYYSYSTPMTAMPQLVALFNGFGGGASALVAFGEYARELTPLGVNLSVYNAIIMAFSIIVGVITFSGSMIAFAKLQEIIKGRPILFPFQQPLNAILTISLVVLTVMLVNSPTTLIILLLAVVSLLLGVLATIRIGGADMPVIISLLNALSGVAAMATGFLINNTLLIIAGTLVGASGIILTQIMAKAMNRPISNILFGAFGARVEKHGERTDKVVRSVTAEDAATVLAYAKSVIVVPGYGLAVAQAQHNLAELARLLESRGAEVKYAIHPVAGRMPGHMNVLLAEANIPYSKLYDLDQINSDFERTDIAIVIGANDVTNPAARNDPQSPLYGMPILNVDQARSILVLKRSMSPGFAGIENELFYSEKTMMLFGDAKDSIIQLVNEVKSL